MNDSIASRKEDHISICLQKNIEYQNITTGFEKIHLAHCALPEVNYEEINTQISFLGKQLSFPLIITGMTGGYHGAIEFNQILAEICQEMKIALGLGSQRQAFLNSNYRESYQIVREIATRVPVIGNIGAAQIITQKQRDAIQRLTAELRPDALAIHLNPLQEILQPEGDQNFKGVLNGLSQLVRQLPIPVMVKETGAGISGKVAGKLKNIGVKIIDVSGAGGTSWAAVEYFRTQHSPVVKKFWDWGIPTAQCVREVSQLGDLEIIASGGIRSGLDLAKACVLGASLGGAALPFLQTIAQEKKDGLRQLIQNWQREFKIVMFLTGCDHVAALSEVEYQMIG